MKNIIRSLLKLITNTGLPGRYTLLELLRPLIVQEKPVRTKTFSNTVFELNLNDLIQRQIFFNLYDREDLTFLSTLIDDGDIVFDIGGNVGFYGLTLAQKVKPSGRVYIFEPVPSNLEAIRRNVELNKLESVVNICPTAVSDKESTLTLYLPEVEKNTGWASVVPSEGRKKVITVGTTSIDAFIAENNLERIALIKLDIEGAELMALKGMSSLLARPDAPHIYIEINSYLLEKLDLSAADIQNFLIQHGYSLKSLNKGKLTDTPVHSSKEVYNLLATKKDLH